MADDTITDERIREKICQMFLESTKKSKKEYIGIEIEIPIINLNKEAVDFDIVHLVTESFKNHFNSFEVEGIDYDGNVYALRNRENDDIVCYDWARKRTYSLSMKDLRSITVSLRKSSKGIIIP